MASERLAVWSGEVRDLLGLSDRLAREAGGLLDVLSNRLGEFCCETAPIRSRAKTLSVASQNIRKARLTYDGLLSSLDMSRRQGRVISRGPARNHLDEFLTAIKDLSHAIKVLESNKHLACVKDALSHAHQVFGDGMRECETNFATTLSQFSRTIPLETLLEEDPVLELISPDAIPRLQVLGETMMEGDHEGFIRVYVDIRSQAVEKMLNDMGLRDYNGLVLQLMSHEQYEQKAKGWTKMLKSLVVVLSEEKKVAEEVFQGAPSVHIFSQVVEGTLDLVIQMGQEVAATKRSHEKLFVLLDMHLKMQQLIAPLDRVLLGTPSAGFVKEVQYLMGEVTKIASTMFKEYQDSVSMDNSKKELSDGTVHPLSASVITYFKRLLRHRNFLRVLFEIEDQDGDKQFNVGTPMSTAIAHVLMVLQVNLDNKSKSYKNRALASLFMMNNVRFMVKSVEQSKAASILGQQWIDRHHTVVEVHCNEYFELTWKPVVANLMQYTDDLMLASQQKRNNSLKERFKLFNKVFSEINVTQCQWIIPDAGLKLKVKDRIAARMIPAYEEFSDAMQNRSFSKSPAKYFKFSVEQVGQIIKEDLFENKVAS